MPPIDFVVTWVDGSDPAWLAEKNRYSGEVPQTENYNAPNRYRDLGLLRYYFRAAATRANSSRYATSAFRARLKTSRPSPSTGR